MINYFGWHLMNMMTFLDYKRNMHKDKILLLGDGFFARGFLHNIDSSRFCITQIYREPFINPQEFSWEGFTSFKFRDIFKARPYRTIRGEIKSLGLNLPEDGSAAVQVNGERFKFDHVVIGLGSQKSLKEWQKDLRRPVNAIVGMGPTGIEIAATLAAKGIKVQIYESLAQDKVLAFLSPCGKETVLKNLANLNVTINYETRYQGKPQDALFCVGTQSNKLTKDMPVNDKLVSVNNPRVHMGGDCVSSNNMKSGQVAYQQGVYVAKKLNGEIPATEPFVYNHGGTALKLGNQVALIEGHRVLPNGIYPDFLLKMYSILFL